MTRPARWRHVEDHDNVIIDMMDDDVLSTSPSLYYSFMMRRLDPGALIQLIIPPVLLLYMAWGWKICAFTGPYYIFTVLHRPLAAALYFLAATTLVPTCVILYIHLWRRTLVQSVPPRYPPSSIADLKEVFECDPPSGATENGHALIPLEDGGPHLMTNGSARSGNRDILPETEGLDSYPAHTLLAYCYRDKCRGRWKPARARHCSTCGVCRAGYDHHCAFLANCLTAPNLPAFLALLLTTPVTVTILASPVAVSLVLRAADAWVAAGTAPAALRWWAWKPSWIVAMGPLGRWGVGLALGWRALDIKDGGGPVHSRSLQIGALAGIGVLLGLITVALGLATVMQVRSGALTVDRERARAYARARSDANALTRKGAPVPPRLTERLARFEPQYWFFVPTPGMRWAGVVLRWDENPCNAGPEGNFQLMVSRGRGWRWILPWNAIAPGMSVIETLNWPIVPAVRARLQAKAEGIVEEAMQRVGRVPSEPASSLP